MASQPSIRPPGRAKAYALKDKVGENARVVEMVGKTSG